MSLIDLSDPPLLRGLWDDTVNAESLVVTTDNFKATDHIAIERLGILCMQLVLCPYNENEENKITFLSKSVVMYYTLPYLLDLSLDWMPYRGPVVAGGSTNSHMSNIRYNVNPLFGNLQLDSLDLLFRDLFDDLRGRFTYLSREGKVFWRRTLLSVLQRKIIPGLLRMRTNIYVKPTLYLPFGSQTNLYFEPLAFK